MVIMFLLGDSPYNETKKSQKKLKFRHSELWFDKNKALKMLRISPWKFWIFTSFMKLDFFLINEIHQKFGSKVKILVFESRNLRKFFGERFLL